MSLSCLLMPLLSWGMTSVPPHTHLDLTRTPISHLAQGSFCRSDHLTDLTMDETGLHQIEPGAFRGLTSLVFLSLRHNAIHELQPGVFEDLVSLEELRFDGNRLQSISAEVFLSTPQLHTLVLDNNLITVFAVSTFRMLDTLRILSAAHNFIGRDVQTYQHALLSSLENLDLSGNCLEDLDVVDTPATSLTILKANYNNIPRLTSASFANIPALKRLYLRGNRIEEIRSDTFQTLAKLVILDLSDNRLARLDSRAFVSNHVLAILNLSSNANLTVPHNLASTSLKVVDVSGSRVAFAAECGVAVLEQQVSGNVYLGIFLLGMVGTGSILFLFVCTTETLCVCLLNAAAADLLIVLVTLPLSAVNSLQQLQDITHCRIFCFSRDVFTGVAVFSVMIHSIERFLRFFTRKLSWFQMFWVWTLSVILALPAYWSSTVKDGLCQPMSGDVCWSIWWGYLLVYCAVPGFVSILLYCLSTRHESRQAEHMATEGILYIRRTRWEVPALTATFVILFLPNYTVRVLVQVPPFVEGVAYFMYLSHAWAMPLVLYHSNATVKRMFTEVYGCNCGAQRRKAEDTVSVSDVTVVQGTVLY